VPITLVETIVPADGVSPIPDADIPANLITLTASAAVVGATTCVEPTKQDKCFLNQQTLQLHRDQNLHS
jgi:hypothetical protein